MKKVCLLTLLIVIAGSVQAQKNMHKIFGTDVKIITGSSKICVYEIDQIPVMSIDQIQGENYVYDYRITRSLVFKKKEAGALILAALDTSQYLFGVNKKCPFMGKYAIQFRKGTRAITIIVSAEPCDKIIIFCPGSIIDKKHIDLQDKSKLISALLDLLAPKSNTEIKK